MGKVASLLYFAILDGVVVYVVPKYPEYKTYPDVKGYNDPVGPAFPSKCSQLK